MTSPATPGARRWFGHPPGLTVLCLTEMWEVFSLYGMRALLVLYLTQALGFSAARASLIFGLYAASCFFTPLLGSIIADRWLGRRRAVAAGSVIMAVGHFMMMVDALLFPALAVIALGNGLFMPSLASQINGLYARGDPARERGFSLYYVGVNLGGFLAPLVCGTLGEILGWHWGFGAAGLGMLAGLAIFMAGQHHLPADRRLDQEETAVPTEEPLPIALLLGVLLLVVLFRGSYEQAGNTIVLWTSAHVDRQLVSGVEIPVSWFLSLNPLFVFAFTPLLLWRWKRRAATGRQTRPLMSMAIGALMTGLGFGLLAVVSGTGGPVSWQWLILFFAVYTWGEIQLLPVGLALFGHAASGRFASLAFSIWFAAAFFGNLLAGAFGTLYSRMQPSAFFALASGIACLAAAGFLGLHRTGQKAPRSGIRDDAA